MTHAKDDSLREALLQRIGAKPLHPPPREPGAPLDWDDIGFLCQGLSFANRPLFAATQDVTARYSLGPRGAWMINLISAGVIYPHELSNVFKIGRSLISVELTRLTEAGLVKSCPGATDRRRTELGLTDEGRKVLSEIRATLEQSITSALSGYSPDEVRLLARMLTDLRENAAKPLGG